MKKTALLLVVLSSLMTVSAMAEDKPASIKLCFEGEDIYPWVMKSKKGLNIIMLEMVAKKTNLKLDMSPLPWKRCLNDVQSGGMDGAFAASYKPDRAEFAVYPSKDGKPDPAKRMMLDSYSLYRLKGSNVNWDGSKFQNVTSAIGTQPGYSVIDLLKQNGVQVDDGAKTADDTLRKLISNRVAGAALMTLEGDNSIATNSEFTGKVERVPTPLVEKPYFLIFGKGYQAKYPGAVTQLWDAIASVRESPEYKQAEAAFFKR
ncbi:polar amino acid transport system substrate-binding protein [Chitinivorax tropicus]|uniref:Polar amino acid transport system substrate-binding protein n=1 Tax=Chitinivorax tropicus TaxID=714531 RepID=A0A840MHU9_9PROT|nr:transporter substrate-binding domain-containing protein [Chitinivorax tropicus]MBB5018784.1 polar amino acid transport system substrate-binding protein [Chitinivorax tropicus]